MGFFSSLAGATVGSVFGGPDIGSVGRGPDVSGYETEADSLLRERQEVLAAAYQRAFQHMAGVGAANAQQIQDGSAQAAGGLLSRLTSSGLTNTSVAPNLARGLVADQSRSLSANNAQVGGLLSGLHVGAGQADAGALGAIAQNLVGRGERDRAFFLNRSGLQQRGNIAQAGLDQQASQFLGSGLGSLARFGLTGGFA